MTDESMKAALDEALKNVGGTSALGRALGISPQAVGQWPKVPAGRVLQVEQLTGIARSRLRPDLYPAAAGEVFSPSAVPAPSAIERQHS